MSDFESQIEQLTRANQRWKTLALSMCAGVCLYAVASFAHLRAVETEAEQMLAEAAAARAEIRRDMAAKP